MVSKVLCTVTKVVFHPTLEEKTTTTTTKNTHPLADVLLHSRPIVLLIIALWVFSTPQCLLGCSGTPQRLCWPPLQRTQPSPCTQPCFSFSCRCSTTLHLVFNIMLHLLGVEQSQMINIFWGPHGISLPFILKVSALLLITYLSFLVNHPGYQLFSLTSRTSFTILGSIFSSLSLTVCTCLTWLFCLTSLCSYSHLSLQTS